MAEHVSSLGRVRMLGQPRAIRDRIVRQDGRGADRMRAAEHGELEVEPPALAESRDCPYCQGVLEIRIRREDWREELCRDCRKLFWRDGQVLEPVTRNR